MVVILELLAANNVAQDSKLQLEKFNKNRKFITFLQVLAKILMINYKVLFLEIDYIDSVEANKWETMATDTDVPIIS